VRRWESVDRADNVGKWEGDAVGMLFELTQRSPKERRDGIGGNTPKADEPRGRKGFVTETTEGSESTEPVGRGIYRIRCTFDLNFSSLTTPPPRRRRWV